MRFSLITLSLSALLVGACGDDESGPDKVGSIDVDMAMPSPDAPSADAKVADDTAQRDAGLDANTSPSLDANVLPELDAREPVVPPVPVDASSPAVEASTSEVDASAPGVDAGAPAADASVSDAALQAPDAQAAPRVCAAEFMCPLDEHPCVPSDDGAGYQCQGQLAVWPMPEKVRGTKAAPKYTVSPAVVLDEVTGLLWERTPPETYPGCSGTLRGVAGAGCTWQEAAQYCEQLTLSGKRWRMPSKIELESLLDFVTAPLDQLLDPDVFPSSTLNGRESFWSNTDASWIDGADKAYAVHFATGISPSSLRDTPTRVRCVHAERITNAPPAKRYSIDDGGAVVRDAYAGLEWERVSSASPIDTLVEASSYCAARGGGFRLPTFKELLTMFDVGQPGLPIDPAFEANYESTFVWSSSSFPAGGAMVLHWVLGIGLTEPLVREIYQEELAESGVSDSTISVRCVR